MAHLWRQWDAVVIASTLITPLAVLAVVVLVRWRSRRGIPARPAWSRSVAEVAMVVGALPWLWLTLGRQRGPRLVYLVPLTDLAAQIRTMSAAWVAGQAIGNLLLFAVLGFFAPVRFAALARPWRVLLLGAGVSLLTEAAQYALVDGRVTSVDDVLLNAAGAALAATLSRRWWAGGDGRDLGQR